jgi:hypothetical protein
MDVVNFNTKYQGDYMPGEARQTLVYLKQRFFFEIPAMTSKRGWFKLNNK